MVAEIKFGAGTIQVTSDDFAMGFQDGRATHEITRQYKQQGSFTDTYLVELFLERLEDMARSSHFGIGFTLGWLSVFIEERKS